MAVEALELHVFTMEQDGDALPALSLPPFGEMPEGGMVMPVTILLNRIKLST
jgi:hypothetical protein